MKFIIVLIMMGFVSHSALCNEATTVVLKKNGAVAAFSEEDGFKLSSKASTNLGVSFKSLSGKGPWTISKSALVRIKYSTGVYRKWDGWITMVLVKVHSQTKDTVTISSIDLEQNDDVAITGVKFLRMTDADLNSDTVDSCSH